jgi:hypothetical protein
MPQAERRTSRTVRKRKSKQKSKLERQGSHRANKDDVEALIRGEPAAKSVTKRVTKSVSHRANKDNVEALIRGGPVAKYATKPVVEPVAKPIVKPPPRQTAEPSEPPKEEPVVLTTPTEEPTPRKTMSMEEIQDILRSLSDPTKDDDGKATEQSDSTGTSSQTTSSQTSKAYQSNTSRKFVQTRTKNDAEDDDEKPRYRPDRSQWQDWRVQKEKLKQKFPEGWNPRKKLSPDALAGIRALNAQFPDIYTTTALADKFEVSPEAIRRILKSKWQPSVKEEERRQERWFGRGMQIWERKAELGMKPPKRWRAEGITRDPSYREWSKRASLREREEDEEEETRYRQTLARRNGGAAGEAV